MTDKELFEWNQRGFIPGPLESEEDFIQRIQAAIKFFTDPPIAFRGMHQIPEPHWEWARHHLQELYDFQPYSIIGYYSNRSLTPWQGAASWVMDIRPGPLCAVQLRKGFSKGKYLGLYGRDEILAHEAVHAARCAFNEPASEEFFAYFTSPLKWRRVLGPILQRPWEAALFLVVFMIGAFSGNFFLVVPLLLFAFIRLGRQHLRFRRAAKVLSKMVDNPRNVRALLFRLTDEEIKGLSLGKKLRNDRSLRSRVIEQYSKGRIWQKE